MEKYFESQVNSVINLTQLDPLLFFIVQDRKPGVQTIKRSEVETLAGKYEFVELVPKGQIDLPVFRSK